MAPSLGTGGVVAGYRIEALLGRGGMASVYLAEDPRLKRKVALKILAPELAADDAFRQRFVVESERLASVDHPNIIPVYEAGEDGDLLFIAMRYVDSIDLKQLIVQEGGLSPERAVSIIMQVAGALDTAHARGLVHRDVKPANILVAAGSGSEHVYLSDFGLTKRAEETSGLTTPGHFMGTIDYVAPEQISAKGVDARTDQYALACVLFECLTGHPPYPKDDDAAVLFSHLSEPPPKVTSERPLLPLELDHVIAKGMAKDKDDRFATCLKLAIAARLALAEETTADVDAARASELPTRSVLAVEPTTDAEAPSASVPPARMASAGDGRVDAEAPGASVPPTETSHAVPVPDAVVTAPRKRRRVLVEVVSGVVVLGLAIGGLMLLGGIATAIDLRKPSSSRKAT